MKILTVAVCGCFVDGKFPLIKFKRNYLAGYWGIPGGKLDDTEFLPEAAEREMQEELEHPFTFVKWLATVDELVTAKTEPVRCLLHVCEVEPQQPFEPKRLDHPEGTVEWFTPEQIGAMRSEVVPSDYRMFTDIFQAGGSGYFTSRLDTTTKPFGLAQFRPAQTISK